MLRLDSQDLSERHRITEEAAFQQSREVDVGQLDALSTKISNFRPQSENIKDEHDKPSTTRSRNLLQCASRLCHKKFTQSSVVPKDTWDMLKEQLLLKCELKPKKFNKSKAAHACRATATCTSC